MTFDAFLQFALTFIQWKWPEVYGEQICLWWFTHFSDYFKGCVGQKMHLCKVSWKKQIRLDMDMDKSIFVNPLLHLYAFNIYTYSCL